MFDFKGISVSIHPGFLTVLIAQALTGNEENVHFLLHYPQFDSMSTDLFSLLANVLRLDITWIPKIFVNNLCTGIQI